MLKWYAIGSARTYYLHFYKNGHMYAQKSSVYLEIIFFNDTYLVSKLFIKTSGRRTFNYFVLPHGALL